MNALRVYHSSVAPEIPGNEAESGMYAVAQATEALGGSLNKVGSGIAKIGGAIQENIDREGRINAMRSTAVLQEHHGTFLKDAPNMNWTDEDGLSSHHGIPNAWRNGYEIDGQKKLGYDELKKSLSEKLPPSVREEWLARVESQYEPRWQEGVEQQEHDLRESYGKAAAANMIANYARSGNFPESEKIQEEARALFGGDDLEWQEYEPKINEAIIWGVAEVDIDEAHARINEIIQPDKQASFHEAIDKWKEYKDAHARVVSEEKLRTIRLNIVDRIDAGDMKQAQALLTAAGKDIGVQSAKDMSVWIAKRYANTKTNYDKADSLLGEAIDSLASDDTYDFQMKLAGARYGEKAYLGHGEYAQFKGLLGKGYPLHAVAGIKAAYNAIDAKTERPFFSPFSLASAATRPQIPAKDRVEQMNQFFSWFDGEIAKGNVPDPEECVVKARKTRVDRSNASQSQTTPSVAEEITNDEVVKRFGGPARKEAPEEIPMLDPDGNRYMVSVEEVQDAERHGWKRQ